MTIDQKERYRYHTHYFPQPIIFNLIVFYRPQQVVYYTAKKNLPPKQFVPHECNPNCLYTITHNLHSYSPLAKPLLSGWERQIFKNKLKKSVVYRAPCGRRIRNMEELHRYLRLTKNVLNVDNFDFDCAIHCLAEYVIDSSIITKPVSISISLLIGSNFCNPLKFWCGTAKKHWLSTLIIESSFTAGYIFRSWKHGYSMHQLLRQHHSTTLRIFAWTYSNRRS